MEGHQAIKISEKDSALESSIFLYYFIIEISKFASFASELLLIVYLFLSVCGRLAKSNMHHFMKINRLTLFFIV